MNIEFREYKKTLLSSDSDSRFFIMEAGLRILSLALILED